MPASVTARAHPSLRARACVRKGKSSGCENRGVSETQREPISEETVEVQVRRAPKVGVFLLLGAVVGLITAFILTYAVGGPGPDVSSSGFEYSKRQVLGFLALWCVPTGAAIFGLFAAWLDARSRKRAKTMLAERDHVVE